MRRSRPFDGGAAALVVGATSGLGEAIAMAFARVGARVVLAGRRQREAEHIAQQIREGGGDAMFFTAYIADETQVERSSRAVERYGSIGWAVNNSARDVPSGPLAERTMAEFDALMAVNVRGILACMKYQIDHMLALGGGSIVNIASAAGHVGIANAAIYTGRKHAVVGLTRAAALEYVRKVVRISAISPGVMDTEMMRRFLETQGSTVASRAANVPIGRSADPAEIAEAVIWLCSDAASYVVGQAIPIDGGITAQ